jgi:hypothetical protein
MTTVTFCPNVSITNRGVSGRPTSTSIFVFTISFDSSRILRHPLRSIPTADHADTPKPVCLSKHQCS